MEKKDNTFNYQNAKCVRSYTLCDLRLMKFAEFITLGVITFGVTLNAKYNNAK